MSHDLDVEVAAWLCTTEGLARVAEATSALDDGADTLTLGTSLRRRGLDPARATAVVGAAGARRRARRRWPDAERLLLTPVGLEQASDPQVAAWRARRIAASSPSPEVWDLGAGLGSDALAIAAAGGRVTAVDRDAGRLRLLEHNAAVLGLAVTTLVADVLDVTVPPGALVHADPARRADGRRARRLAEYGPPVGDLLARHRRAAGMALVLSPALDRDDPDLPGDAEVEFVGDATVVHEAVAWRGRLRDQGAVASATLLPQGLHRVRVGEVERCAVGEVGTHLIEVTPAAVRARLHDEIGAEIGARRLAARRALLTVDGAPPASPWYRARRVLATLPAHPRAVRRWLREHPATVEIAVHGLDADPARWWQQLGRPPRGPDGLRIELIRTDGGGLAVVTEARSHSHGR